MIDRVVNLANVEPIDDDKAFNFDYELSKWQQENKDLPTTEYHEKKMEKINQLKRKFNI